MHEKAEKERKKSGRGEAERKTNMVFFSRHAFIQTNPKFRIVSRLALFGPRRFFSHFIKFFPALFFFFGIYPACQILLLKPWISHFD